MLAKTKSKTKSTSLLKLKVNDITKTALHNTSVCMCLEPLEINLVWHGQTPCVNMGSGGLHILHL